MTRGGKAREKRGEAKRRNVLARRFVLMPWPEKNCWRRCSEQGLRIRGHGYKRIIKEADDS